MRKAFTEAALLPENFHYTKCTSSAELLTFTKNLAGPFVVKHHGVRQRIRFSFAGIFWKRSKQGFLLSKLTIVDDITQQKIVINAHNEFYEVWIQDQQVACFSDIICIFDNVTHLPLTSDERMVNLSVTVG